MKGFSVKLCLLVSLVLLTACSEPSFDGNTARVVLEAAPVPLNGEQIVLNEEQLKCGNDNDLWVITQLGAGHSIARLTDEGRKLQFSDDVRVGEAGLGRSVVQVRGKFALRTLETPSIEEDGKQAKVVEAKVGVVVDHECFKRPLPALMGVRKGEFSTTTDPMFRLRLRETWSVEALLH